MLQRALTFVNVSARTSYFTYAALQCGTDTGLPPGCTTHATVQPGGNTTIPCLADHRSGSLWRPATFSIVCAVTRLPDWTISDVASVCAQHGVRCAPPSGGGSHYKVSHLSQQAILTISRARPVKQVYIRKLVRFIEAVEGAGAPP